jgi:addiction module HigA family antidote
MRERRRKRLIKPNHPGHILKELYLKPLNISVTEMASYLLISRKTFSKIINCHGAITPDMGLRLSKVFNTTPQLWLNLQREYDLWCAENETDEWKQVVPLSVCTVN